MKNVAPEGALTEKSGEWVERDRGRRDDIDDEICVRHRGVGVARQSKGEFFFRARFVLSCAQCAGSALP